MKSRKQSTEKTILSANKKAQARNPSAKKLSGVRQKSKARMPMGRMSEKNSAKMKSKHKDMVAAAAENLFNSQQPNPPSGNYSMAGMSK